MDYRGTRYCKIAFQDLQSQHHLEAYDFYNSYQLHFFVADQVKLQCAFHW